MNVVRFLFNLCGVRVLIRTFIWLPLNYSLCLLCEHGCNTYTAATLSPWAARIKSLLASKSKRRMLDVPSNTTTGAAYLTVQTRSWPGRVFKNKNLSLSLSLSLFVPALYQKIILLFFLLTQFLHCQLYDLPKPKELQASEDHDDEKKVNQGTAA